MTQVFISYSRKDLEFVDRLANDLKSTGFQVWYDLSGLEPGTRWRQEIQKAIQESQFFLVVLSPNSIVSDWVEREFLFASDQDKKIIPLLYQPCTLPMWSLNLHFIDMQGKNYSLHYQDLLKVMGVRSGSEEENPIAIRYIEIGDEYRKRGKAAQAIESYQQAINVEPGNLKAHNNMAAVHLSEQAYAEAAAVYERALQISNADLVARAGWSDVNMALGNQARAEGKLDEAIRCYLEILRVVPEDGNARKSLANIYISQADKSLAAGQADEALAAFSEAIKYTPDDLDLVSNLEKLQAQRKASLVKALVARSENEFSAGNWEQALAALQEALQISPQDAILLKKIANLQAKQQQQQLDFILSKVDQAEKDQRWDAAVAGLKDYLQLKPDDKVIQKRMTDLMQSKHAAWLAAINLRVDQALANRNWEAALAVLQEALQLEPDNKEFSARANQVRKDQHNAILNATLMRADQAAATGRWDDSIEILNSGLINDPGNATLKAKLSETQQARRKLQLQSILDQADATARAGKWDSALAALNQVLAEEPDNSVFLEKFNQILALERDNKLKTLRTLARNLLKEQKFAEAQAAWNEILLLDPKNRQEILAEIEEVNKAQNLEAVYSEGVQAYNARDYQKSANLLNNVVQEQPGYKDAARLLAKARKQLHPMQNKPQPGKNKIRILVSFLVLLGLGISATVYWQIKDQQTAKPALATEPVSNPSIMIENTSTPLPQATTFIITSVNDTGPGTLRQALLEARAGDIITFDPAIFPPEDPVAINLYSALPVIDQGYLTLDASNAGVVLNGAHIGGEWVAGIDVWSDNNIIRGLGIVSFSGPGIALQAIANFNTIGGDRSVGLGQIGQANFVGANSDGVAIWGSDNVVTGNLVGILGADATDLELGNKASGIYLDDNASRNTIGPDNIIAYNGVSEGGCGIEYTSLDAKDNNITANIIFGNEPASPAICYNINPGGQFVHSTPPTILFFELGTATGSAAGVTCPNCFVEIFSTDTQDAKIFEGSVTADEYGNFVFTKSGEFAGPYLTATSRAPGENTSELSLPTPKLTDIGIALNAAWVQKPVFETAFITWSLNELDPNARLEEGELIITSDNMDEVLVELNKINTNKYVVEFEVLISNADPGGSNCLYRAARHVQEEPTRMFEINIPSNGQASLGYYESPDDFPQLATFRFDPGIINKFKLILLNDQVAVLMNGQIAFATILPGTSENYLEQKFGGGKMSTCEFDNYKFWDLSGVNLNP